MLIDSSKFIFFRYVDEYGIFDEEGCLIGIKEEAPAEVRESFEEYRKYCKGAEEEQ